MSGNAVPAARKVDSRIQKTRDRLGDAIIALMQEKPFDSITVQEVLDRAGVGRSTFYTHYRDKVDLLVSDADDFFGLMSSVLIRHADTSERVAPVREFFCHVAEAHAFIAALHESGRFAEIMELGQGHFARAIDRRLAGMPRARGLKKVQRAAVSHALAGAMMSLLGWWLDRRDTLSPRQADDLFHQMVWAGIDSETPRKGGR